MSEDFRLFAAELKDSPTLDLHGSSVFGIQDKVDQFIVKEIKDNDSVEIIFGIGKGRLREEVMNFLKNHPLVEKIIDKGGSCIVLLGKN